MTDLELLVVGGGPVGLAAAIEARFAGLEVAVLEPRQGPIDKACGEGLMPGAVDALDRLGVSVVGHELRGISYLQDEAHAVHRFVTRPGRGVRRTALHAALAERAAELGVISVSGRLERLEQDARRVTVSGPMGELHARWVLGADGLHSRVRTLSGLAGRPFGLRRFGLRRHFRVAPWSDNVEVYWSDGFEAYVTPVAPDLVGIALLGARLAEAGGFESALRRIPTLAARLGDAEPDGTVRGAGPLRQRSTGRVSGRVLLVGDASGYVDALTGEGLRVGFAQARSAVGALAAGAPASYEREWGRVTRDFRLLTSTLVAAASSPLRPLIVPAAVRNPALFGAIVERLAR
jgi:flavin-dependent dehydrogenase